VLVLDVASLSVNVAASIFIKIRFRCGRTISVPFLRTALQMSLENRPWGKGTRVTSETPAKLKNQRGVRPARIEDIDGEFDLLVGETDE